MKKTINKITIILRGYTTEQVVLIAEEASKYNCFNLEITTNSPNWTDSIRTVAAKNYDSLIVGAGTVMNKVHLEDAINAGAQFVLAPIMMSKEMLDICNDHDVVSVPAAFSPSEVYQQYINGADVIKLFPAIDLPVRYIKDICAPLGKLPIMVVGGVNAGNVKDYFAAGATYAGIGSGICDKEELKKGDIHSLRENLQILSAL